MEENKPPTAAASKLKQVKLSFFKSTPVSVKTTILGQAKKRRNSGSSCLDSPTKSAKPGKPLNPIAADNTECQNTKAHKIRRICNTKPSDGNDHEVSSSSEAEAGNIKCGSGKLDRFICKLSKDPHQEISSTNEMFQICQQSELPIEDLKTAGENQDSVNIHLQPAVTDAAATEPDCIIIDDAEDVSVEKSDADPSKNESLKAVSEPMTSDKSEICSEVKSPICKDKNLKVAEAATSEPMASDKSEICSEVKSPVCKDKNLKVAEAATSEPMASDKSEICSEVKSPVCKDKNLKVAEAATSEPMASDKSEICSEVKSPVCKDKNLKVAEAATSEPMASDKSEICSEVKSPVCKDKNLKVAEANEEDFGEDKSCEDVDTIVVSDANDSVSENDTSISLEEGLDDSVKDISALSAACSTPIKSKDSDSDGTPDLSMNTPVTPAVGSGKRKRKVDSGKKTELDSTKLKKETEKLERKRKLEEEKAEKERVKKEKKEAKEKQKQEQKEKLEKEKEEKERAKEEERKKKEEERIKREEEKKKKQAALEAKQEEKRKKEEERKKKEDEKKQKEEDKLREEEDKKKKDEKIKQAFQSFFIKPKDNNVKPATPKCSTGMFIPFELKKDMHLAPAVRRDALTEDKKNNLDQTLADAKNCVNTYLEQLKTGDIKPLRTGRMMRTNPQPEEDEDVKVVHDSEALKKVTYCVKILQFHTDYRPPYCGTWRKKPTLSPRNPWKKDESVFDYEVDSDEEWEEEEPGESLSCSDGEEEKGEEVDEDEDDADGWMVPHGYLSEDEGCNEDDEITPEKLKLQQLAKAKAWEEEQKRKLRVAPVITVGCFFEDSPSCTMIGDVRLLYEYKAVVLTTTPVQTSLFGCPEPEKSEDVDSGGVATTLSHKRFLKKSVPDEAMPDLIRLVHGNTSGIKRLIREFRVYWLRKTNPPTNPDKESLCEKDEADDSFSEKNGDASVLNESVSECCNITESDEHLGDNVSNNNEDHQMTIREEGYGCSISKRQLELKITSMACREKRPGFNKICWYVHEKVLTQFNMNDIKLPNSWAHILPGPVRSQVSNKTAESPGNISESQTPRANKNAKLSAKNKVSKSGGNSDVPAEIKDDEKMEGKETPLKRTNKDQRSIKDFARSKDELVKKSENQVHGVNPDSPGISSANAQETPKNRKKPNAQKSIVEFTSKSGSKRNLLNIKCKSPQLKNIPANQNSEVICIESDSEQGATNSVTDSSKTASCSDVTVPVISEVCSTSVVEPENAPSGLVLSDTKSNEEPMEVDEGFENTSQEEKAAETQNSDDTEKKDGMECVVTG